MSYLGTQPAPPEDTITKQSATLAPCPITTDAISEISSTSSHAHHPSCDQNVLGGAPPQLRLAKEPEHEAEAELELEADTDPYTLCPGQPVGLLGQDIPRQSNHPEQMAEDDSGKYRRFKRLRWRLSNRHADWSTGAASPASAREQNLTAYIVYVDGVKLEAVADTGSAVNVVSQEVTKRNPKAWNIVPHDTRVAVCNGETLWTSGYVQASLRFEDSEELHDLILYIVDGLPLDMLLCHDILVRTGTVEFKRPGAIVKAGLYPAGSEHPAVALVLANLVAAKRPSMTDWLKRLCCIRSRSSHTPPTSAEFAGSLNIS